MDVGGLALLFYFIIDRLPLGYLFADTVLTGGDAASWYQVALHLKTELLPAGRLFGWDQGNFFGYPNFQYYFIPPFLLAVLLSYVMPLTMALKLVTVLGVIGLPVAVYGALRLLAYPRPLPLVGAWASLVFLFNERYTMFGGNWLSTLAGEFSYSIAFLLLVVFVAFLRRGVAVRRYFVINAVLLALIGLSHAFVFLVAVVTPLYFLIGRAQARANIGYVAGVYGLAFLLMAFWVLPMLALFDYTTPINMIWRFHTLGQWWDGLYGPLLALGLAAASLCVFRLFRTYHGTLYLYLLGVAAAWYLAASVIHVADIRFVPFMVFFSLMAMVDVVACLASAAPRRGAWARGVALLVAVIVGGTWIYDPDLQAPAWVAWNYSGYETKPALRDGTLDQLRALLADESGAPRVAWEKASYDQDYGSDRVFENLPLFTGRWSTEGIHYASGLLSKAISVMHGEYSLYSASPEPIVYSHYNIDILPARFRMFNIRDFIAVSPTITGLLDASPHFELRGRAGRYGVYSLRGESHRYVETPDYHPQVVEMEPKQWKQRYHAWFRRGEHLDVPLVATQHVPAKMRSTHFKSTPAVLDEYGIVADMTPIPVPKAQISAEHLDNYSIRFRTDRPGEPHLIKVAYSPNWYALGGEELLPVSPGLMLVFPNSEQVELRYGRHVSEVVGVVLSLLGLTLCIVVGRRPALLQSWVALRPVVWAGILIGRGQYVLWVSVVIVVAAVCVQGYTAKQRVHADYQAGLALASAGREAAAIPYFQRAADARNVAERDDSDVPSAMYALARAHESVADNDAALAVFKRLLHDYPRWIYVHEIHAHLGRLLQQRGEWEQAAYHYQRCLGIDVDSDYVARCQEGLAQVKGARGVQDG